MKIIIPSYKRASKCVSAKYFKNGTILVNKSEVGEYKKYNDNEIMEMPDELGGNMARVRNFILDNVDDDVVMIDDDVKYIGRFEQMDRFTLLPEEAEALFEMNFDFIRDFGTVVWGLQVVHDKKTYREYSPLSLSSVVLGPCLGVLKGCDIRFDESLGLKEDYDFSLQVLNKYRKTFRWNKYFYLCDHIKKEGGCASYRTTDIEKEQMRKFVKKWGSGIVKFRAGDINPIVKVPIKGI